MEESEMINKLISCCENKEFKKFVQELYAGVTDGEIRITDLVKLIISLYAKEIENLPSDDTGYSAFTYDEVFNTCGHFAYLLLRKGLRERRWTYKDGVFSQDGRQVLTMDKIDRMTAAVVDEAGGDDKGAVNYLSRLKNPDSEGETFRLAVLDHCTEENIFAALTLVIDMEESRRSSLEQLWDRIPREKLTLPELRQAACDSYRYLYTFTFLEQSDIMEQEAAGNAIDRVEEAETYEQFVYAALEAEFLVRHEILLPRSAYLLFTGQPGGFPVS